MLLSIELVPSTSWGKNLRNSLTKRAWSQLSYDIRNSFDCKCAYCKSGGMLHCHEVWDYNDRDKEQELVDLLPICVMCHHVKHMGHAEVLDEAGVIDINEVIAHFCKVNKCHQADFIKHRNLFFQVWYERSKYEWKVSFGKWAKYIK